MSEYDLLESMKKHATIKIAGLKKAEANKNKFRCCFLSDTFISNKILKTVIEIFQSDDNFTIYNFNDNIEFDEYYKNGEKIILDNIGLFLDYSFTINNVQQFMHDFEKYKITRIERGYDRKDTYISWKIPVEIPFVWIDENKAI
jgi:hypothetical protein